MSMVSTSMILNRTIYHQQPSIFKPLIISNQVCGFDTQGHHVQEFQELFQDII